MKLKKGDEVKVMAGKDKGKVGKIEKIIKKEERLVILGVNLYKRHLKTQGRGRPGGIVDIVRPLPQSSVALVCPKCKKVTRVGFKFDKQIKMRTCKKCGGKI